MSIETVAESDMRVAAMAFAAIGHNGQLYDGAPFILHPIDVAAIADEFGFGSPHMLAGCLMHDVLEDTDVTIDELREVFPEEVVQLVWCVTDATEGRNRAERKANTYEKTAGNRAAVALKLCDRLSNVRASVRLLRRDPQAKNFIGMYQKEHAAFREALHREGEYDQLWQAIDDLLEQPEHCMVCENQGGPLSVESGGVVRDYEHCPTCAA